MAGPDQEKPEFEEWVHWAQVAVDRLTTCVHVYARPPHEDVFVPEADRQRKSGVALDLLRRLHPLIDESETPSDSVEEAEKHAERVIGGLTVLLDETLRLLPQLSADMQMFLKSPWHSQCNGRLAEELFRGPGGDELQGIGSGYPENGRLPALLHNLLEREQTGEARAPRKMVAEGPSRHTDTMREWSERNSRILRSAGRIE